MGGNRGLYSLCDVDLETMNQEEKSLIFLHLETTSGARQEEIMTQTLQHDEYYLLFSPVLLRVKVSF